MEVQYRMYFWLWLAGRASGARSSGDRAVISPAPADSGTKCTNSGTQHCHVTVIDALAMTQPTLAGEIILRSYYLI